MKEDSKHSLLVDVFIVRASFFTEYKLIDIWNIIHSTSKTIMKLREMKTDSMYVNN